VFSGPQVVVTKARPGPELLVRCEQPLQASPEKTVEQNAEALVDLALKFRECEARQAKLVGWFGDEPKVGGGRE
jgi:hypothetical protein